MRFSSCLASIVLSALVVGNAQAQDPFQVARERQLGPEEKAKAKDDPTKSQDPAKTKDSAKTKDEPEFVRKTDEEWRKILTRDQYWVTRQKGTEPAFSGKYAKGHYRGTFSCVCCGSALFSSRHKFDSGTGWPSFWQPVGEKAVVFQADNSALEARVEVECRRCGAHLGHVFADGPPPTGQRYCINSVAITLKAPDGAPAAAPSRATAKTKARAKAKSKTSKSSTTRTNPAPAPTPTTPSADGKTPETP